MGFVKVPRVLSKCIFHGCIRGSFGCRSQCWTVWRACDHDRKSQSFGVCQTVSQAIARNCECCQRDGVDVPLPQNQGWRPDSKSFCCCLRDSPHFRFSPKGLSKHVQTMYYKFNWHNAHQVISATVTTLEAVITPQLVPIRQIGILDFVWHLKPRSYQHGICLATCASSIHRPTKVLLKNDRGRHTKKWYPVAPLSYACPKQKR